jgi:hypothetical protein
MQKHYQAHWGWLLIVLSTLLTAGCVWFALAEFQQGSTSSIWMGLWLLALVVGCALFTIRGYTVTPDAILVHRLLWATRLPRAGLQSAQFVPVRPGCSVRIGNGGFFSFSGWYYNTRLGLYRVFVTDHRRMVFLRYPNRLVAISPAAPEEFVHDLALASHAA